MSKPAPTKATSKPIAQPRFTESEIETLFAKLAEVCAGIESQWHAITETTDTGMRARHLDSILLLSQIGGFIADHAGEDCSYYGDIYQWLGIPEGVKS